MGNLDRQPLVKTNLGSPGAQIPPRHEVPDVDQLGSCWQGRSGWVSAIKPLSPTATLGWCWTKDQIELGIPDGHPAPGRSVSITDS